MVQCQGRVSAIHKAGLQQRHNDAHNTAVTSMLGPILGWRTDPKSESEYSLHVTAVWNWANGRDMEHVTYWEDDITAMTHKV